MAMTFDELQQLMKAEDLKFFIAPDRPVVRFAVGGLFGKYDIVIQVEDEGRFLQFRTVDYLHCPSDHANLAAVLRVLGAINYRTRLVKLGWDASDGEIVAYADLWVMDGKVTQEQFHRMMGNFLPTVDEGYQRLKATMDTGKDPGEEDTLRKMLKAGGDSLPPALRELLDKLAKGEKPEEPEGAPKKTEDPIKEI